MVHGLNTRLEERFEEQVYDGHQQIPISHLVSIHTKAFQSLSTCLQKDLAKDLVSLILELGAKDNGDTIEAGLDIDGFFGTVMHCH